MNVETIIPMCYTISEIFKVTIATKNPSLKLVIQITWSLLTRLKLILMMDQCNIPRIIRDIMKTGVDNHST